MRLILLAAALLAAAPAIAGVKEAVEGHLLPGIADFAEAADVLAQSAKADCTAEAVKPWYQSAFDAWLAIGDFRLGPTETAALGVAFWPDDHGATQKTLRQLVAAKDPAADDPGKFAEVSIAGRGLFALDLLLYDPAFSYGPDDYTCTLVRAVTADLDRQAQQLQADWQHFAVTIETAGDPGNAMFQSKDEAAQDLYTQLLGALEFTSDQRLGRPMGTFDKARPTRAEAWRSGRPLRDVQLAVAAAGAFGKALSAVPTPETDEALEDVETAAAQVGDPDFAHIDDPQVRFRVEALQQAVQRLRRAVEFEIGASLGVKPGFNSLDGD